MGWGGERGEERGGRRRRRRRRGETPNHGGWVTNKWALKF